MNAPPLNRTCPPVPEDIFNVAAEDADLTYHDHCDELWLEVCTEVMDPDYTTRTHHNISTYDVGCRGPLCRKAYREHPRRKSPTISPLQQREERVYDPVLEYFHTVIKYRVRAAQQEILNQLKEQVV